MYLIKLSIKNAYAHKNTVVEFKDGINWLLGENEGGKSELLDMIGYALFGKGLRSKINEYPGLEVKLFFRIKNTFYGIERGKSTDFYTVTMDEQGNVKKEAIATGKVASNNAIIQRLGYDFSVYESLNYSKQLDSTALTSAKETERLKLINKINGVEEAVAFEKYLDDQRKSINAQLKALKVNDLTQEIDFIHDEELDALSSDDVFAELTTKVTETYSKVRNLESLEAAVNTLPEEPKLKMSDRVSVENPEKYVEIASSYFQEKDNLVKLIADYSANLERLPQEPATLYTEEDLKEYETVSDNNNSYRQQQEFFKKHQITCPSCSHDFVPNHTPTEIYEFKELPFSEEDYRSSRKYLREVKGTKEVLQQRLDAAQNSLDELELSVGAITPPPSKETLEACKGYLRMLEKHKIAQESYMIAMSNFTLKYKLSVDEAKQEVLNLPQVQAELTKMSELKERISSYKTKKQVYDLAVLTQGKVNEQVKELTAKLVVTEKALAESKRLKLEIQQNCIPVLNTIASKLINKLTGGKRYGLTLNETFELTLDGKPISSYSGSTIVLANVAFRLALVEMFFKKTFPVFIGDEIDAFADDIRAQHMHDSLLKLNKEGYQLILVSHNKLEFQGNKINLADIKGK